MVVGCALLNIDKAVDCTDIAIPRERMCVCMECHFQDNIKMNAFRTWIITKISYMK